MTHCYPPRAIPSFPWSNFVTVKHLQLFLPIFYLYLLHSFEAHRWIANKSKISTVEITNAVFSTLALNYQWWLNTFSHISGENIFLKVSKNPYSDIFGDFTMFPKTSQLFAEYPWHFIHTFRENTISSLKTTIFQGIFGKTGVSH